MNSKYRLKTLLMIFLWSTRYLIYFGLTLNVGEFGTNVLMNFTAMGLSEIIASLLAAPLKRNFSRKASMFYSLIMCGLGCAGIHYLPSFSLLFSLRK